MTPHIAASKPGERQADPERQAEGGREQRIGIGADGVESDIAEIEQAGEPDHDVQPPAQHHVDHDLDAVVVDPFQRAGRPEQPQHDERKQDRRSRARTARTTCEKRGAGARRRRDALALARGLRRARRPFRPRRPRRPGRTRCASRRAPSGAGTGRTGRRSPATPNDSGQRADQDQLVVDVGFGVVADDRKAEAEGDERRGEGVAQRRNDRRRRRLRLGDWRSCGVDCGAAVMLRPSPLRAGPGCRTA